jgi:DNA polymerase-3 subunit alpha
MTQACLDFGIESFEDIVMIGAICRPVTLENGMYGVCLHNRLHPDEIEYKHPLLGDILNNTHGIVLYQEHVMDICRKLANFSYKEADTIRALIGKGASLDEKKKEKLLADSKKKFFNGCKENKISKELTEELWGLIGNASYGFNKAHATSYALISYRTAWLKRYYPAYFMAAVLTTVSNDLDRISEYMSLCKSLGIKIIKPNILAATKEFGVEERNIKFGFSAIKGIGDKTAELIESISGKLTKNSDLYDVLTLLEKACKKQIIVALIKSGALDSIIENRRMIIENIDLILKKYRSGKKKNINQEELFQMKHVLDIPKLEEYSTTELLAHEYETTGLFLTSDFLAKHRETFVNYCVSSISQLESLKDKTSVKFGGIIISVSEFTTKRQQKMAKFGIESLIGNINFVCFPNQWEKFKEIVSIGNPVIIIADSNEGRNEWIIREMRKL